MEYQSIDVNYEIMKTCCSPSSSTTGHRYGWLLLFLILALSLAMIGCTKDATLEGPALVDLFGDFQVLETVRANRDSVRFGQGETVYLQGRFNKLTDWRLEVHGLSSGARKIIQGKSRSLDALNCVWNGSTTVFPMFRAEETEFRLFVENDSLLFRRRIKVLSVRPTEGFVVADFENGIRPGWTSFVQSGANMSFVIRTNPLAGQGNSYYDMGGRVNWDWLIGMLEFPAAAYQVPRYPLLSNPEQVYFNALVYLPDSINNALLLMQFREDDNLDGQYNTNNEDMYSLQCASYSVSGAQTLQRGWNLISARYSDLVCLVNGQPSTPAGNNRLEPDRLHRVSLLMLANPASGYSQLFVDNIVFTSNGPLQP
ncbi:MAG: hypothetical protein RLZZ617_638 [Bacteroidota bacterium]|jgi:hypothetical protein